MEPRRNLIIALCLSVIGFSGVSIYQTLNQGGVLGLTTTTTTTAPTKIIRPLPTRTAATNSGVCKELTGLVQGNCDLNLESPTSATTSIYGFCTDLQKLIQKFCPTSLNPTPSNTCQYGVTNLELGAACTTTNSQGIPTYKTATYTCGDNTTGTVQFNTCVTTGTIKLKAKESCLGHGNCEPSLDSKVRPTGNLIDGIRPTKTVYENYQPTGWTVKATPGAGDRPIAWPTIK